MSARRPSSAAKKHRPPSASPTDTVAPSTLTVSVTAPIFSSAAPANYSCYSAPPILFFPKPSPVPLPPRPASSRSSRLSPNTARSPALSPASSARPATARAASSERKERSSTNFTAADFHVPIAHRPASPRAAQHSAWTTSTPSCTNHFSTSCAATSIRTSRDDSDDDEADADSSTVESFISPFFLPHDPSNPNPTYRASRHPSSTSHSTYRTVAVLPSTNRHSHRQRFLHDNSYQHSFDHIIGGSSTTTTTTATTSVSMAGGSGLGYERSSDVWGQTRRLYDGSSVDGECGAHLPGGREHLLGKWKPVARNGNELFANIVQHSKFHQPTFV